MVLARETELLVKEVVKKKTIVIRLRDGKLKDTDSVAGRVNIVLFPNIQTSTGADTVFCIAGTESSSLGRIMVRL